LATSGAPARHFLVKKRGFLSLGIESTAKPSIFLARAAAGTWPLFPITSRKEMAPMPMTKSEIATMLAEKVGISKKQVNTFFEAQADLAYKQAKNTFVIPGIGKLKIADRPAREMVMQFGPKKGQTVKVPKSKKLKFTLAKVAKDAILGAKK
jgi:DNA-binding protein HU-beta